MITKRIALGQILLCSGCCCGRTDRGMPEVPVERIKAIWRSEKLNRTIQLTISGCLGPCDVPNVVMILTPAGSEWLGLIDGDADYDLLIEWARACHSDEALVPLPEKLLAHRFHRFSAEVVTA